MATDRQRSIIWHGFFLFLIGLLTGLAEPHVTNPRMGLAAHLEGLMNGTFLIALGAVWQNVRLSPGLSAGTYWSALYGTYGNWITTSFAAITGTKSMTLLSGAGYGGSPWQEALVTAGFITVGIAMLAMTALTLWGLRRTAVA